MRDEELRQLRFRDPARARALAAAATRLIDKIGRQVTLMHVCGTHEQALARFGLRALFPPGLELIMGPGCPVCVTDSPEVDEGVALALAGVRVATYGDMLRVPGTTRSLADVQADGGKVHVVYTIDQAVELARKTGEEVVFFATGFETTAVTTAAVLLGGGLPDTFSVLSAHKYVPSAMEIVAGMPGSRVEGFLAAGHAATITGYGLFEPFAARHRLPVVVAGFEPLDILAATVKLLELVRDGRQTEVANLFPRCVTREGNVHAQRQLWRAFRLVSGRWRGIAEIPDGNLRLREELGAHDARRRHRIDLTLGAAEPSALALRCICGDIMAGLKSPHDCPLFGKECQPETPIGACMVSSEGSCKIWHLYGGRPDLREVR